ncbi:MAG: hypothetical protein NTV24_03055 [Candidatus Woesebacteria bacterium]|nr:hypothetical protein [Candidatus Woesebacteria bacterium]
MNKHLGQKTKYLLVGLLLLSVISVVFVFSSTKPKTNNNATPQPSQIKTIDWSKLTPGESTTKDVTDVLGNPIIQKENVYFFKSSTSVANNEAVIENGTAQFFKEIVTLSDKKTVDTITSKYGLAPNTLYGSNSINGFDLYVYPDKGVAYLGNSITRDLLEIWHFTPTDIDTFLNKWGQGYSVKPPKPTF